jgi:hypothetical protein
MHSSLGYFLCGSRQKYLFENIEKVEARLANPKDKIPQTTTIHEKLAK